MRLLTFNFLKNCKFKTAYCNKIHFFSSSEAKSIVDVQNIAADPGLVEISSTWKDDEEIDMRLAVKQDMQVIPDFISEQEEDALLAELEPQLKRMRYEFDHWDNAIQGYRETERSNWSSDNAAVLARVRERAFPTDVELLPHVHVLDLAPTGHIKPHVDAVRFCGAVIAGLCLVSSAVMRLQHAERPHLALDALLVRRSLYIMRGAARYSFTHAVLGGADSAWRGAPVPRRRRVSVIRRARPPAHLA